MVNTKNHRHLIQIETPLLLERRKTLESWVILYCGEILPLGTKGSQLCILPYSLSVLTPAHLTHFSCAPLGSFSRAPVSLYTGDPNLCCKTWSWLSLVAASY